MGVGKDVKFVNSNLRAKGIKHGVIAVERSHFVDADGELREDVMQWQEDRKHFSSPCLQSMTGCLVWLRCIPAGECALGDNLPCFFFRKRIR
jgi:hypothetical protein